MTQITETGAVIKISVTTTLLHSGQLRKGAQSANTGVISEGKTVPLPLGDTAEEPKTTKITKLSLLITHIKIIFFLSCMFSEIFCLNVQMRHYLLKCGTLHTFLERNLNNIKSGQKLLLQFLYIFR